MRPDVALAFDRMERAARADGVTLLVTSGYRSDAEQAVLFAANPDPKWVAPPGTSLHRNGTELDLGPPSAYGWLARQRRPLPLHPALPARALALRLHAQPALLAAARGRRRRPAGQRDARLRARSLRADAGPRGAALERLGGAARRPDLRREQLQPVRAEPGRGAGDRAVHARHGARRWASTIRSTPGPAIDAQAHLMRDLLRRFASVPLALAAYNAGPGAGRAAACASRPTPRRAATSPASSALLGGAGEVGRRGRAQRPAREMSRRTARRHRQGGPADRQESRPAAAAIAGSRPVGSADDSRPPSPAGSSRRIRGALLSDGRPAVSINAFQRSTTRPRRRPRARQPRRPGPSAGFADDDGQDLLYWSAGTGKICPDSELAEQFGVAEATVRVRPVIASDSGCATYGGGMKPIKNIDDPRYVKAMSHPLRVRILAMLDERKASPNQLAGWLGASLGTVAYHVRTLEQLGLIDLVDETRVRGAVEHHYRAKARPNVTVEGWAKAPPIAKQAAVGSSLDVIGEYARVSAAAGGFDRSDAQLRRALLQAGRARLRAALEGLRQAARAGREDRGVRGRADRADPHADDVVEVGRRPDAVRGRPALGPRGRRQAGRPAAAARAAGSPRRRLMRQRSLRRAGRRAGAGADRICWGSQRRG